MEFTWDELSDIAHAIKEERTVICGAIERLAKADSKLKRVQDNLDEIIIQHNNQRRADDVDDGSW